MYKVFSFCCIKSQITDFISNRMACVICCIGSCDPAPLNVHSPPNDRAHT